MAEIAGRGWLIKSASFLYRMNWHEGLLQNRKCFSRREKQKEELKLLKVTNLNLLRNKNEFHFIFEFC